MKSIGPTLTLAALLIAAPGCGEPPVDGALIGQPIFELPLRVGVGPYGSPTMRVTLLWSADPSEPDRSTWIEHGPIFTALPAADGHLRLFEPPPIAGVGRLVAHDAPDGQWRPELPLFAVGDVALVYTPSTGYFARRLAALCCPDELAGCLPCAGDDCSPERALLALAPDSPVETPCGG